MNQESPASQHELLIRIDERQQSLIRSMEEIKGFLGAKVDNDSEYKEAMKKLALLWDERNNNDGKKTIYGVFGSLGLSIISLIVTLYNSFFR